MQDLLANSKNTSFRAIPGIEEPFKFLDDLSASAHVYDTVLDHDPGVPKLGKSRHNLPSRHGKFGGLIGFYREMLPKINRIGVLVLFQNLKPHLLHKVPEIREGGRDAFGVTDGRRALGDAGQDRG